MVTDMESQDKWLTIEELSGYLKWRFDRDDVDDWMKNKRIMTTSRNNK